MGVRHRRASGPPVHQASLLHVPTRSERFKDRSGGEFERRRRVTAIGYTDRVLANYRGWPGIISEMEQLLYGETGSGADQRLASSADGMTGPVRAQRSRPA